MTKVLWSEGVALEKTWYCGGSGLHLDSAGLLVKLKVRSPMEQVGWSGYKGLSGQVGYAALSVARRVNDYATSFIYPKVPDDNYNWATQMVTTLLGPMSHICDFRDQQPLLHRDLVLWQIAMLLISLFWIVCGIDTSWNCFTRVSTSGVMEDFEWLYRSALG